MPVNEALGVLAQIGIWSNLSGLPLCPTRRGLFIFSGVEGVPRCPGSRGRDRAARAVAGAVKTHGRAVGARGIKRQNLPLRVDGRKGNPFCVYVDFRGA